MIGQEISARKITWSEVGSTIKGELKKLLGKDIECLAQKADYDYWAIRFSDYEMPIEELDLSARTANALINNDIKNNLLFIIP